MKINHEGREDNEEHEISLITIRVLRDRRALRGLLAAA
jgi:hypothetical protein